jgi:putative heme-binding domain-containing protein
MQTVGRGRPTPKVSPRICRSGRFDYTKGPSREFGFCRENGAWLLKAGPGGPAGTPAVDRREPFAFLIYFLHKSGCVMKTVFVARRLGPQAQKPDSARYQGRVRQAQFGVVCTAALLFGSVPAAVAQEGPAATPAERINLPPDFQAELLYSVPIDTQGSWVSLAVDPQGRLLTSDQYGKLYRVTVPAVGEADGKVDVEALDVGVGTAHGLLYAFDSLYVVAGEREQGLYRLRDTTGDDQFDDVKLLRRLRGGGEHGPHAVVLSPDGKSIYICAGNHTDLPTMERSLVPRNWDEDQLLPRMWDAGGHAVGRMAPGGWIARTDPEGSEFELVSIGYRNQFDIAFNPDGELFTFDADMEWDIGAPWYRPTRVNHATAGSEFGWRSGTGKWPEFYPDSLPATVDIGPGSPTGVVFGTGAKFPEKYQRAFFIADWSYGKLYAVQLEPDGSSYRGEFELFASASPLAVTDVIIHPQDGAMYFATGGRRTQSGLYRITYQGSESTEPAELKNEEGRELRALRHRLESLFTQRGAEVVEQAWPYLSHPDRFIRYAARIAVEHQPVELWQQRALKESNPESLIQASIALARNASEDVRAEAVARLGELPWSELDRLQQLSLLRAYGLLFIRLGAPTDEEREVVFAQLDSQFPARGQALNQELARLLIYLEAPDVLERTLTLLETAPTQEEQLHYALCLRVPTEGWSNDQRKRYFAWFQRAAALRGGHSFQGFLANIRNEVIEKLDDEQKELLGSLLDDRATALPPEPTGKPRDLVKQWTVDELVQLNAEPTESRDFERGRALFAEADCFKCHRFDGQGGIIGPDLTGVGNRFDFRYLVESVIEPDKAVSDQYQATVFVLDTGVTVVGKVANLNNDRIMVITNMLEPGNLTAVRRGQIEEQFPSPTSMMPAGLVDTFEADEILDLLAYMRSGGDPEHEVFQSASAP